MSGILERRMIVGEVQLSGKRKGFVAFPWEEVSGGGDVYGWEPAEPMPVRATGGDNAAYDIDRFVNKPLDVLPNELVVMEWNVPYFYHVVGNQKTLLHGGFVQFI